MCEFISSSAAAITAAVVSAISTAVSTTMGVVSANQTAQAQKAQYEFQAEQERRNAETAERNATQARQKGIEDARLNRMKSLAQIGELKTANAANGIDINTGTALDTIEDTATMGELDALNSLYQGNMTAQNYNTQADNLRQQAYMDTISGKNITSAAKVNAFGNALSGIGDTAQKFAGQWYDFKKNQQNIKVSASTLKDFV